MKHFLLSAGLLLSALGSQAQVIKTYTGSLLATDPTIPGDRLLRDGVPSACATPKAYPGTSAGAGVHYKQYVVGNTTAAAICVNYTLTANCTESTTNALIFGSFYTSAFVPANLATNYKTDMGGSPLGTTTATGSVTINSKETLVIVISGLTSASTCSSYTLSLSSPVALPVRVSQGVDASALATYPNPVVDVLHIEAAKAGSYTLFNATGQFVRHITGTDVSMADLPGGVYLLQQNETKATTKIVKL